MNPKKTTEIFRGIERNIRCKVSITMILRAAARKLIAALPHSMLYEIFYQTARTLGVRSYEINGRARNMIGPLYDQSIIKSYMKFGGWSENIVQLFTNYLTPDGGVFYDIGANIGMIAIPLARITNVQVVAFEPDPHNCALLRANVAMSQLPVEIINAAVADRPGHLQFSRSEYNSGDHRISADGPVTVCSIALDMRPPVTGRLAVKIDTQGAEPLIFSGGEQTLARAGLIVSEFWPWGMRRMGLEPSPILNFAERYFTHGMVLRHDQVAGKALPIADVLRQLDRVVASAGEHDAVDLVLIGAP